MTNAIDNAISRIGDLAQAMTGTTIKSAPDYPIENVDPLPMCVAYVSGGNFQATNASMLLNFPNISCEFHFSRVNIKQAYQQINAVVYEFPQRLAKDPTLNSTITTIVFGENGTLPYIVRPFDFGKVQTQMLMFTIPIKILESPI